MEFKTICMTGVMLLTVLFSTTRIAAEDDGEAPAPVIVEAAHSVDTNIINTVLAIPSDVPRGPREVLQEYELEMYAVTQQFSARLGGIMQAVSNGQLTREQGEDIAGEQYQTAQMRFDLLDALRMMLAQDLADIPPHQTASPSDTENEIVVVALPFSSLQLNPLLAKYLGLSSAQSRAIQDLMSEERKNMRPLMERLQATKVKLLSATDRGQIDQKEVETLATLQARLLGKLIVTNCRLQAKVYKLMSPDQQKKLDEIKKQSQFSLQEIN